MLSRYMQFWKYWRIDFRDVISIDMFSNMKEYHLLSINVFFIVEVRDIY